jgi:hypothetical protein
MHNNEDRADAGEAMLREYSDNAVDTDGTDGLFTDMSDVVALLVHAAARAGFDFDAVLDFDAVVAHAKRAAVADLEDGPEAELRPFYPAA